MNPGIDAEGPDTCSQPDGEGPWPDGAEGPLWKRQDKRSGRAPKARRVAGAGCEGFSFPRRLVLM